MGAQSSRRIGLGCLPLRHFAHPFSHAALSQCTDCIAASSLSHAVLWNRCLVAKYSRLMFRYCLLVSWSRTAISNCGANAGATTLSSATRLVHKVTAATLPQIRLFSALHYSCFRRNANAHGCYSSFELLIALTSLVMRLYVDWGVLQGQDHHEAFSRPKNRVSDTTQEQQPKRWTKIGRGRALPLNDPQRRD